MDCCCEMEYDCTSSGETAVSASLALLEEKPRRARRFGEYLEQHPDEESPLSEELQRATTAYRIALHNLIQDKTRGPK